MLERLAISPTDRKDLTARMTSRAWRTPQVGIVLSALFLFHFLASFVGLFFYEEQIPLVKLVATVLMYIIIGVLITLVNQRCGGSWTDNFGMGFKQLKKLVLSPVFYLVSLPFLANATIDFSDELIGARFVIENPNATASCGCGTSFSI